VLELELELVLELVLELGWPGSSYLVWLDALKIIFPQPSW